MYLSHLLLIISLSCLLTASGCSSNSSSSSVPVKQATKAVELKVTAVTDSGNDGNVPENTVDHRFDSRWSANGDGQWILYDLGLKSSISSLQIAFYQGNTRSSSFDIELSDDKQTFRKVLSGKSSGTSSELESFEFPETEARYVRILGHGNSTGNGWNSISETSIFGKNEKSALVKEIPSIPTQLKIAAGDTEANLSWTPSKEAEKYVIQRSTMPESGFETIHNFVSTTTYKDTNLTDGKTYYYQVAAANALGESKYSPPVTVKPEWKNNPADMSQSSQLKRISIQSKALGKDMTLSLYLPKGYDEKKKYPVLYVYHGFNGNETNWMPGIGIEKKADELIASGKINPIIIVAPQADNGYGLNTPKVGIGGQYEDYITQEVIQFVDSHLSTISTREGRYIGGQSMGGFISLHSAFRHPDLFSKVGGHMPAVWLDDFSKAGDLKSFLYPTNELRKERDPLIIAKTADLQQLKVYLDSGDQDDYKFYEGTEKLHQLLIQRGIQSEYHNSAGKHDSNYIRANVERYLIFYAGT